MDLVLPMATDRAVNLLLFDLSPKSDALRAFIAPTLRLQQPYAKRTDRGGSTFTATAILRAGFKLFFERARRDLF